LPEATQVKQILEESNAKQATLTIAAVQPTGMMNTQRGQLLHSSAGQMIITASWQLVDGTIYSDLKNPSDFTTKGRVAPTNLEHPS